MSLVRVSLPVLFVNLPFQEAIFIVNLFITSPNYNFVEGPWINLNTKYFPILVVKCIFVTWVNRNLLTLGLPAKKNNFDLCTRIHNPYIATKIFQRLLNHPSLSHICFRKKKKIIYKQKVGDNKTISNDLNRKSVSIQHCPRNHLP